MPIRGVSDRDSTGQGFKIIGKLRKGGPKQQRGDREIFGEDLDHFRFTSDDPEVVKAFHAAYGNEPRSLMVYLPYDTMEENFGSWRELYGLNGLTKLRCDGENWVDWIDGAHHYHGEKPCDKDFRDTPNRCPRCSLQPVGRLSLILPELWYAKHIGLVTLETHSWNDIHAIASKLAQCEPLKGKTFTLWREDTKIGAPNEKQGTRMAVTKSLVYIELTNDYLVAAFEAAERRALVDAELLALPEPSEDDSGPQWQVVETRAPVPAAEPKPAVVIPPTMFTVGDLLATGLTAEQIMTANENRIPTTTEECQAVLDKLSKEAQGDDEDG